MIRSVLVSMCVFLRYACSECCVLRSLEPDFLTTFRRSSGSKNPCGDGLTYRNLRVAGPDARAKMLVYPHALRSNGTFSSGEISISSKLNWRSLARICQAGPLWT